MKLYYHPLSTYCHKVLIAFYEKGLDFDGEIVNLFDAKVREEYRTTYPMGKIPLLFDDDDHMVPESSIIVEYVDALAEPTLIWGDTTTSRKIRFKDRMYDLYLTDSVSTLFFQALKPVEQQDQERIASAKEKVGVMYRFMQAEFEHQSFSSGDTFSLSDCAAAAGLFYASKVAPFDEHANIVRYWQRLLDKPSIQRVHEEAAPFLAEFEKASAA